MRLGHRKAKVIAILWLTAAVAVASSCRGGCVNRKIANKPTESRTAEDLKGFLSDRWKVGEEKKSGVYIRDDSLFIIDDEGGIDQDNCLNGEIRFLTQSRIEVEVALLPENSSDDLGVTCSKMKSQLDQNDTYTVPIRIYGPERIQWWFPFTPNVWDDVAENQSPILLRADKTGPEIEG